MPALSKGFIVDLQNLDPLKYTSVVGLAITAFSCVWNQAQRTLSFKHLSRAKVLLAGHWLAEAYIFYDVIWNAALCLCL